MVLVHPEELHTAAANALLKTLEEPGDSVFFILVSAQPRAVLETIISRCQQLNLPPPSRDELAAKHQDAGEPASSAPTLAELERRGLLMSSDELASMRGDALAWLDAYLPNFLDLGRVGERIYAIPHAYGTPMLYWNKDLFAIFFTMFNIPMHRNY